PVVERLRVGALGPLQVAGGRPHQDRADERQRQRRRGQQQVIAAGTPLQRQREGRQRERRPRIARQQPGHRVVPSSGSLVIGAIGLPVTPMIASQTRLSIGPAAVAPVPACSIMPTMTYLAPTLPFLSLVIGPQVANQEVSCLPSTSAVPVLPPSWDWYLEPM